MPRPAQWFAWSFSFYPAQLRPPLPRKRWLLKKGRSGVCALWSVTEPSRRRRKVSKWLHEDDGLDTGGELPINALPQRTNETQTNNLRATRSIPQLTARPTIMPLPGSIFMQLTTCLLLGSASTPPHYSKPCSAQISASPTLFTCREGGGICCRAPPLCVQSSRRILALGPTECFSARVFPALILQCHQSYDFYPQNGNPSSPSRKWLVKFVGLVWFQGPTI